MNIPEQIAHLANLIIVMEYYEKFGAPRNKWMMKEYDFQNAELLTSLKEKHDEART